MNAYITFDHVEQEVHEPVAFATLYRKCWLDVETTAKELCGLEHVEDYEGVSMYYQYASDTYYYVDTAMSILR